MPCLLLLTLLGVKVNPSCSPHPLKSTSVHAVPHTPCVHAPTLQLCEACQQHLCVPRLTFLELLTEVHGRQPWLPTWTTSWQR